MDRVDGLSTDELQAVIGIPLEQQGTGSSQAPYRLRCISEAFTTETRYRLTSTDLVCVYASIDSAPCSRP